MGSLWASSNYPNHPEGPKRYLTFADRMNLFKQIPLNQTQNRKYGSRSFFGANSLELTGVVWGRIPLVVLAIEEYRTPPPATKKATIKIQRHISLLRGYLQMDLRNVPWCSFRMPQIWWIHISLLRLAILALFGPPVVPCFWFLFFGEGCPNNNSWPLRCLDRPSGPYTEPA